MGLQYYEPALRAPLFTFMGDVRDQVLIYLPHFVHNRESHTETHVLRDSLRYKLGAAQRDHHNYVQDTVILDYQEYSPNIVPDYLRFLQKQTSNHPC